MAAETERVPGNRRRDGNVRTIGLLMLVAFVGGAIATGWIFSRVNPFASDGGSGQAAEGEATAANPLAGRIDDKGRLLPATTESIPEDEAAMAMSPQRQVALAARVGELEDRLSRINVQAQAASGNAARAEGLLIAFAARRALDRGSPLGYIEDQLRLRFGDAQPRAVRTVINAAERPVTLEELNAELKDIGPSLMTGSKGSGWWVDLQREMSSLFVLRKEGTPSPAPEQRLQRAERFLEAGNVEAAIAEVQRLPGEEVGAEWLEKARRYNEARRALDVIETAAILEPRELRDARGTAVRQSSPLAPDDIAPVPEI